MFGITPPNKANIAVRLNNICNEESVEVELDSIRTIVNSTYPDIRRSINGLQRQVVDGKVVIDKASMLQADWMTDVLNELKGSMKFNTIRKIVADSQVKTFEELYRFLFENIDEFASTKVSNCIIIIAEAQYQDTFIVDKEINIMAMFSKIITTLEK